MLCIFWRKWALFKHPYVILLNGNPSLFFLGKYHFKQKASLSYFKICGISKLAMTQESFDQLEQKGHNRQNDYRFANVQGMRVVGHGTETYHVLIGTCALLSKEVVAVFFKKKGALFAFCIHCFNYCVNYCRLIIASSNECLWLIGLEGGPFSMKCIFYGLLPLCGLWNIHHKIVCRMRRCKTINDIS